MESEPDLAERETAIGYRVAAAIKDEEKNFITKGTKLT